MRASACAAAESAMRLNRPLFVADYAQPADSAEGNQYFIGRGATALRGDRSGRPNLARVYEVLGISNGPSSTESATDHGESNAHANAQAKLQS